MPPPSPLLGPEPDCLRRKPGRMGLIWDPRYYSAAASNNNKDVVQGFGGAVQTDEGFSFCLIYHIPHVTFS